MKLFNAIKRNPKTSALIGVTGLGLATYLGHSFGLYNLSPLVESVGTSAKAFGATTFGAFTSAILGRTLYDSYRESRKDTVAFNQRVHEETMEMDERKISAMKTLEDSMNTNISKMDRNYNLIETIENDPQSLKEIGKDLKDEFTSDMLNVAEDATGSILDSVVNILATGTETVLDAGLDIVEDFVEDKTGIDL